MTWNAWNATEKMRKILELGSPATCDSHGDALCVIDVANDQHQYHRGSVNESK